jgi:hypothetical protein
MGQATCLTVIVASAAAGFSPILQMGHWPTKVDSAGKAMTRGLSGSATGRCRSIDLKVLENQPLKFVYPLMPSSPPL